MSAPAFSGVLCPLITPLASDGTIDTDAWGAHIDRVVEAGINGVLVFGSIGEFSAHTFETKKAAVTFAVSRVTGRVPVLVGVTCESVAATIEYARFVQAAGADGAVLISPYYFSLTPSAQKEFFSAVAEAVELPLMLYNFPARTGSDLAPATIRELALTFPHIVAVKDTVDTISHTRAIAQEVLPHRADFTVLSGFDEYYLVNRVSGGRGVLSGLTNVIPEVFVDMHESFEGGDLTRAHACAAIIAEGMKLYGHADLFVSAIKYAAAVAAGAAFSSDLVPPFVPLSEENKAEIRGLVSQLQEKYAQI